MAALPFKFFAPFRRPSEEVKLCDDRGSVLVAFGPIHHHAWALRQKLLGRIGRLGCLSVASWKALRGIWGGFWGPWGIIGGLLGASWGRFGGARGGALVAIVGEDVSSSSPSRALPGSLSDRFAALLEASRAVLGSSWGRLRLT